MKGFKMKDRDLENLKKEIADELMPFIINDLYKSGKIKENELDDKEAVYKNVLEHFVNNLDFDIELLPDHRDSILNAAQNYSTSNYQLSITLYATFIEHTLNFLIQSACFKIGIDSKTITDIIRSVNINGKSTWLIRLLGLRPINPKYIKTILEISEIRNSYLHYKWKPYNSQTHKETDNFKKVRELVKYLHTYETKYIFQGKKQQINRTIARKQK